MSSVKPGSFKYVKPPRRLMDKVGTQGGVELDDAMSRADAVLAKTAEDFPNVCNEWITTLNKLVPQNEADLDASVKDQLLQVSNDIRGQGGTFGFPLVTLVADSLVKFLDPRENTVAVEPMVVRLHIQALERLMRDKVTGDGGSTGVELRTVISALAKRRQKPNKPSPKPMA